MKPYHVPMVLSALFTLFSLAHAQQLVRIPRIGFLAAPSQSTFAARQAGFLQGLKDLGYADGKNIQIEYRYAGGQLDRLPTLVSDLVNLNVDVLVATGPAGLAAKNATKSIPIVFVAVQDPIGTGLVESLSRPGGNATGLSNLGPELSGKRLELLKEAFPALNRAVFLSAGAASAKETQKVGSALGVQLQSILVRDGTSLDGLLVEALKHRPQALITSPGAVFLALQPQILEFAARHRLPAMYGAPEFVDAGGLMSYGPNPTDQFRRAAVYVDKVLKGTKPADLPVEQPMKFEFVVNLKTAEQIGVIIPPNVLQRADRVIR
jgi:putative ABC transport system substrate-binding protein